MWLQGLQEAQIDALPWSVVCADAECGGADAQEADLCSICFEPLEAGSRVYELGGCAHKFHQPCIRDWLKRKAHCPLCRAVVGRGASVLAPAEPAGPTPAPPAGPPPGRPPALRLEAETDDVGVEARGVLMTAQEEEEEAAAPTPPLEIPMRDMSSSARVAGTLPLPRRFSPPSPPRNLRSKV